MITEQHSEESLSAAYIGACAAKAGCNMAFSRLDYGIDGTLAEVKRWGDRLLESGYPVNFQAKASVDWRDAAEHIAYDLEVKAFNDLVRRRIDGGNPSILILLCLPKDREKWLELGPDYLTMRHCCYWYFSRDDYTSNTNTQVIHIPKVQRFTPEAVTSLLVMARSGTLK